MRTIMACAFALVMVSNGALAFQTTAAPASGSYDAQLYVQSASSGCLDKAGYAFLGELSFAGLSASSFTLRALESGSNFAVDSIQVLTVKTGKGTTTPSGSLAWTGAGVGGSWSESGTFSANIVEIDTHDFILQLKESYSGCSAEDINVDLVRTAVNQ